MTFISAKKKKIPTQPQPDTMEDPEQEKEKPSLTEICYRLERSYQAMLRANELMELFDTELIAEAKALINEQYKDFLSDCSVKTIEAIDHQIKKDITDLTSSVFHILHRESEN
jgi:hypothetical protein